MESSTVEFFIEKVRNASCLWNRNHVSYRDTGKKDLIWERIAKECGMCNGRESKIQWKKLRDSHREALRRRKPSFGPSAQHLKPWKFEDNMKFLLLMPEDGESIVNDLNDTQNSFDNTVDNMSAEVSIPESVLPTPYSDPLDADTDSREQNYAERREMRRRTFDDNRFDDGLTKLFDSFCQKTRELPKYLQLRVQREIFASVLRAEEEALSLNNDTINRSLPSSSSYGYNSTSNVGEEFHEDCEESEYENKYNICKSADE